MHEIQSARGGNKVVRGSHKNKKIKEVTRFNLGRREKALDLYREILYSQSENSRNHEYQADSLGYLLYKNTKYNIHEYLSAMTKLEEQYIVEMDSLKLETLFHYLGTRGVSLEQYLQSFQITYPQNYYWDNYNIESKLLESHPEAQIRVSRLKFIFPELNIISSSPPSEAYAELAHWAFMEQVPNLYHHKFYGFCLYTCLLSIQKGHNLRF